MAASRCLASSSSLLRAAPCFLRLRPPLLVQSRGRKSRNDPPAKSKAGRIKLPPPVDPEELVVVQGRYLQYKSMMAALRADFKEEVLQKQYEEKVGSLAAERMKHETEEHRMLIAWNSAENARLRKKREERYAQEQEQEKQRQLQATISREAFLEKCRMEREEEILQLQEEAKHFITLENLDQRIEEALDNPKNLNFAVDKEGRVAKRTALQ